MTFTLRQARCLESRLRNLSIDGCVIDIRAYDSSVALSDITQGIDNLADDIDNKIDLNAIRHVIKNLINLENMKCGVSELLNQRDELHSRRDILNTLSECDSIERQLAHVKDNPKATRTVCVYSEDLKEDMVSPSLIDIDTELNEISRQLNALNNSVTIEIGEDDINILKDFGVL